MKFGKSEDDARFAGSSIGSSSGLLEINNMNQVVKQNWPREISQSVVAKFHTKHN